MVFEGVEILLSLLYPITPHICEELRAKINTDVRPGVWTMPSVNEQYILSYNIKLSIQVNSKVRDLLEVDESLDEEKIKY